MLLSGLLTAALAFEAASPEIFENLEESLACLEDSECSERHEAMRSSAGFVVDDDADDGKRVVPCLVDPKCAASMLRMDERMRMQPCSFIEGCYRGSCGMERLVAHMHDPGCTSVVMGRLNRSIDEERARNSQAGRLDVKYAGEVDHGIPHGLGSIRFQSGMHFQGWFSKGAPNGRGHMRLADGSWYLGTFEEGKFNVSGHFRAANGGRYLGENLNGAAHGRGKVTTADGYEFAGEFKGGTPYHAYQVGRGIVLSGTVSKPGGEPLPLDEEPRGKQLYEEHVAEWQLVLDKMAEGSVGEMSWVERGLQHWWGWALLVAALLLFNEVALLGLAAITPKKRD